MDNIGSVEDRIIQAIPIPLFLIDAERCVRKLNKASEEFAQLVMDKVLMKRCGEVLNCIHSSATSEGCGFSEYCKTCTVQNSVLETINQKIRINRKSATMTLKDSRGNKPKDVHLLLTTAPMELDKDTVALVMFEDISELIQLRSLIPICARCKKIRDESEYWHSIESYFSSKLDVAFTHTLCTDCMKILYPEVQKK